MPNVNRYSRQVEERRLPQAYGQNFVDNAATGVNVAEAWGRLGDTIQKAGEVMKRRQDEWDSARVMEANNAFITRMTSYLEDPDSGIMNTRKLGLARGTTKQADADFDKFVSEIASGLENDAQRQAFRTMAQRSRVPFWKQVSHFEASQVNEYRDQVFKNTLDNGLQIVLRDPLDGAALEAAAVQGTTAIEARYIGADASVISSAKDEYISKLETARITAIAEDDPVLAEEIVKNSPHLIPSDAAKIRDSISAKADLYKTQVFVDQHVQSFPPEKERDGIDWIRKHYSGPEEEKRVTAYRQRINEITVNEENVEVSLRKRQNANFDQLILSNIAQGRPVSSGNLYTLMSQGELTFAQVEKIKKLNENLADVAKIKKEIRAENPHLSPEEIYSEVRSRLGISQAQSVAYFARLRVGIMQGSLTKSDIATAKNSGYISDRDADRLFALESSFGKEQKSYFESQLKILKTDIGKTVRGLGIVPPELQNAIIARFGELTSELDPSAPNYREEVSKARTMAVAEGYDQYSGKKNRALTNMIEGYADLHRYESTLDNRPHEEAMEMRPTAAGFDLMSATNGMLLQGVAETEGKGWSMGAKGLHNKNLDCSGLVSGVWSKVMKSMNTALGVEVFDKSASAAVNGTSGDIIRKVSEATGWERLNPSLREIRPGMIIGLDAGARDRGYKGIDHIATVLQDPATGRLYVHEAASKVGVRAVSLDEYFNRYRGRGKNIYVVNPLLMAKIPENPDATKRKNISESVGELKKTPAGGTSR